MLKRHQKSFDALTEKMSQGATVEECLQAIEAAPEPEYD
jgi:predicted RNase H-like HicB family nuclease